MMCFVNMLLLIPFYLWDRQFDVLCVCVNALYLPVTGNRVQSCWRGLRRTQTTS